MSMVNDKIGRTPAADTDSFVARLETKLHGAGAICESRGPRQGMYFLPVEKLVAVLRNLVETQDGRLATVTGIDVRDGTELIYHLCFDAAQYTANLKILIPRTVDAMESITPWLPGAEFIERELHDVLGLNFPGHPRMERLILADDWPEGVYPLRRGFRKEDAQPRAKGS